MAVVRRDSTSTGEVLRMHAQGDTEGTFAQHDGITVLISRRQHGLEGCATGRHFRAGLANIRVVSAA